MRPRGFPAKKPLYPSRAVRRAALGLLLACGLAAASPAAPRAWAAEGTVEVTVPPGKRESLRLRNVPQGARVEVSGESSGALPLAFVGAKDHSRFPEFKAPLFRGTVDRTFSFAVSVPVGGHYFIVMDNRAGSEARTVRFRLKTSAAGPPGEGGKAAAPRAVQSAAAVLQPLGDKLNKLFIFDKFPIGIRTCGRVGVYASTRGILFCREYAEKLYGLLDDPERATGAIVFILFREVGSILLAQWKHPLSGNEDAADEFTTALLILLGQKDRVRAEAIYLTEHPEAAEAMAEAAGGSRHALSVPRARNITRWSQDPGLLPKWQKVLVPHMRTAALLHLRAQPFSWADPALVERELAARGVRLPPRRKEQIY